MGVPIAAGPISVPRCEAPISMGTPSRAIFLEPFVSMKFLKLLAQYHGGAGEFNDLLLLPEAAWEQMEAARAKK